MIGCHVTLGFHHVVAMGTVRGDVVCRNWNQKSWNYHQFYNYLKENTKLYLNDGNHSEQNNQPKCFSNEFQGIKLSIRSIIYTV